MIKLSKFKVLAFAMVGLVAPLTVSAVPKTDLTKSCKSLVNPNFQIPKAPIRGMPEKIYKRQTRALEQMAEGNYNEAIEMLQRIFDNTGDNYIKAVVSMNLASAYAQQNNYDASLPHFENALQYGEGNLQYEQLQAVRLNTASLSYSVGKKANAARLAKEWLAKSNKEDPKPYILMAVMAAEDGKYREAVCPAWNAVRVEKKPKKQYHNLLLVAHYELKDLAGSAKILKEMVNYFPEEKSYWRQLSTLYLSMDRVKESLALMEMLYLKGGFETENDYKTLSALFAYQEIPYRSAEILEEGMDKGLVKPEVKNWKSIAANYRVSKEVDKAIVAYGKTAEADKDGEEFVTQAELYLEKESYRDSIKALDKALAKGVKDKGRVLFTKGSAQANLGQCKTAIRTLEDATKYKNWRKRANAWIAYVKDREKNDKC
ncbi:tetratricopeptide repeat protein [Aliikangiella marina]|uniref:Tetratricopeptide repeat protein n=1 Tax=Aliikangiella marina TaxID=1712262 RepID=A0A545TE00_9GAMM|nr:tetratricopeptide repeat protein [Aliikangiella marina]TQV75444.1 tetratricopeptide repeat protein [Aliikangiella marina]